MADPGKPRFFARPEAFGAWLAKNGAKRKELVVGYWKVGTGRPSMTWAQSVEQALMHGWIDGVRHSLGAEAYTIRFTPRKAGSHWSLINLRTAKRLIAEGRMAPAGAKAFAERTKRRDRARQGSYEQRKAVAFAPADLRRLKQDAAAWRWFRSAAPSYQRACAWWVQSAKRPETRERRLRQVIDFAHQGSVVPQYKWRKSKEVDKGTATAGAGAAAPGKSK